MLRKVVRQRGKACGRCVGGASRIKIWDEAVPVLTCDAQGECLCLCVCVCGSAEQSLTELKAKSRIRKEKRRRDVLCVTMRIRCNCQKGIRVAPEKMEVYLGTVIDKRGQSVGRLKIEFSCSYGAKIHSQYSLLSRAKFFLNLDSQKGGR